MKIAFLPSWCKNVSLIAFLYFTICEVAFLAGYIYGFIEESKCIPNPITLIDPILNSPLLIRLGLILSMAVFILSKDHRDDEFLQSKRAESLLIALLITLACSLILSFARLQLDSILLLTIQFTAYIVTFKIKKPR